MCQVALVLTIAGTIVALEVLYRYSLKHDGLSSVSTALDTYSWTYIAPAYLFMLGLLFVSYTFGIRTLEPYLNMYRAPSVALRSVTYAPANQTSLGLFGHAIRHRSAVGVACATVLLVFPFLRIVVAGLFVISFKPTQQSVHILTTGTLSTSLISGPPPHPDIDQPVQLFALSQAEKYQLPLPAWTTTVEAVGEVDLSSLAQQNGTVIASLPIVRADLVNCTTLDPSEYTFHTPYLGTVFVQFPAPCDMDAVVVDMPSQPGWFGQFWKRYCGGYAVVYGKTQDVNASAVGEMTVTLCSYEMTQSVMSHYAPDIFLFCLRRWHLSIHRAKRDVSLQIPVTDDGVRILAVNASSERESRKINDFATFEFGLSSKMINTFQESVRLQFSNTTAFDPFMQLLVMHNASAPLDGYLNPAILMPTVSKLYSTFWAIYASRNLRVPVNGTDRQAIDATLQYDMAHVVQQIVPTRIMQALLGAVLICGVVMAVLFRTEKILPKAPHSIGSVASLLVGSSFLQLGGLQKNLSEQALEPYLFRLGWRLGVDGKRRFGVYTSVHGSKETES